MSFCLHRRRGIQKCYNIVVLAKMDKYGRGSAAANGEGFVDLAHGDTFAALEAQLKRRIAERFDNLALGISASIGSKRNASELAKHLASGEEEEAHKFAAKNIGVLFARGQLGVSHDDKKAVAGQRWITRFIRVFTPFWFAGDGYLATLTLKDVDPDKKIYAVEAVEINQDAKSGSTPRGAMSEDLNSAPFQDLTSQLAKMVSYYVGDVNCTHPNFVGRTESFTVNRTVELLENLMSSVVRHQPQTTKHQSPTFSIIIPVYNVAPYLRECLDSVLSQDFENWECVAVDDESTDEGPRILDEYAAKDKRIRVIHQKNRGEGGARNSGIAAAKGEWVFFLDGDDVMASGTLDRLNQIVESHPDEMLIRFGYEQFQDGTDWVAADLDGAVVRKDVSSRIPMADFCTYVWQHLYRRDSIRGLLFKSYKRGCDRVFVDDVLLNRVQSFVETPAVCYGYRVRAGSAMNSTPSVQVLLDEMDHRCDIIEMCDASDKDVRYDKDGGERWLERYFTDWFVYILFGRDRTEQNALLGEWRSRLLRVRRAKLLSLRGRLLLFAYYYVGRTIAAVRLINLADRAFQKFKRLVVKLLRTVKG